MRLGAPIAALVAACTSQTPTFAGLSSITLRGQVFYADGSRASGADIQFILMASGEELFPAGVNGCSEGDEHAQALQVVPVSTGADGSFSLTAPMAGFVRATDRACPMSAAMAAGISRVDVRAQANADFSTCLPYCRRHMSEMCYADCAVGGKKFIWSTTLTAAELGAERKIRFETLGPRLTDTGPSDPPLPDLRVDGPAAQGSLRITREEFSESSCAFQDACVGAPGKRTLLRFEGDIQNLGSGDLRIGSPENNPLFKYSECHGHYHLANIMTFELLDQAGAPAMGDVGRVVVRKQGFCIQGVEQIAGDAPDPYDCENQGLAPGWEDIYASSLSCQWLDVTGVPPGDYSLRITVNASRTFPESDFDNDSAVIPVSIP